MYLNGRYRMFLNEVSRKKQGRSHVGFISFNLILSSTVTIMNVEIILGITLTLTGDSRHNLADFLDLNEIVVKSNNFGSNGPYKCAQENHTFFIEIYI